MALVWCDGFEGYADANSDAPSPSGVLVDKYMYSGDENQMQLKNDSTSWWFWQSNALDDWSLRWTSGVYHVDINPQNVASGNTLIAGIHFYPWEEYDYTSIHNAPILCFKNTNADMCLELRYSTRTLYLVDATANYVAGSRVALKEKEWCHLEVKVFSDTSNGTAEVRVNGATVITANNIATATANGIILRACIGNTGQGYPANYSRLDNFYICDATGNTNNDFLGPVTVKTLWPDGDDSVNWSTTANSANHYENVNLLERAGGTDYVEESSSNVIDLFTVDDLTSNFDEVFGVVVWAAAQYVTSNAGLQTIVSSNGTTDTSSNMPLTTDVLFNRNPPHVVETDPDTGNAWTNSAINAMKIGFKTP